MWCSHRVAPAARRRVPHGKSMPRHGRRFMETTQFDEPPIVNSAIRKHRKSQANFRIANFAKGATRLKGANLAKWTNFARRAISKTWQKKSPKNHFAKWTNFWKGAHWICSKSSPKLRALTKIFSIWKVKNHKIFRKDRICGLIQLLAIQSGPSDERK